MRTFRLKKIVRDGVFENMLEQGQEVDHRVLEDRELVLALKYKIAEEVMEVDPDKPDALKEVSDTYTALDALTKLLGSTREEVDRLAEERYASAGGFEQGIYVETVALQDDDPWIAYYSSDPVKYPEVEG